jgi:hypothetical protein
MLKRIKLSENVIVSDPCYEAPTWCQVKLDNVLPGDFLVHGKMFHDKLWGNRVDMLIAIHYDYAIDTMYWDLHDGTLGVDSGQCGIFDEVTYRNDEVGKTIPFLKGKSPFDSFNTDSEGDVWYEKMCDNTLNEDQWGTYDSGVVSSSGCGDGSYSLYIAKNDDEEIIGILIDYGMSDENEIDTEFFKLLKE